MHIIYLAGNSLENKNWIEKVKSKFDTFSTGKILYYDHWDNSNTFIDFEVESQKLIKLTKDQTNYCVFAKSVGTILALKTIYEKTFNPQKAILCGHPYLLAQKAKLPINDCLKSLIIPTTFIQNESDPLYSYKQLKATLEEYSPTSYSLVKNAGIETHSYDNYRELTTLAKNFFK